MLRPIMFGLFAVCLMASCGGTVDETGAGGSTGGSAGSSAGSGGASGKGGSTPGGSGGGGSGGVAGSGGSVATGGSSGLGGSGGMPPQCEIQPGYPGPYPTTFQFRNQSSAPVWLSKSCSLQFEVSSCADNYTVGLSLEASCTSGCEEMVDGGGCIACGACKPEVVQVNSGEFYEIAWPGFQYTFEQVQGCTCHVEHVASAGKYRVQVSAWDAAFDPMQSTPAPSRTPQLEFGVPSTSPIVVLIGK